ncbi:MAG TPA: hypothetical protein VFC69_08140 [Dysgonamonadaceae bacterium]|nr:hypothetical protein [Dysgonamonadaceae bacterium]
MHQTSRRFRSNIVESRFTPIIFTIIAVSMRLGLFLSVGIQQHTYQTSFVWQNISPLFSNHWMSFAASTLSIFIIAFIFSDLNTRFTLIRLKTSLPFTLVLLILSTHPLFLHISPNYISTIFILLSFYPLIESYQHYEPHSFSFKMGVLIAIAATFQVFALFFLPLMWLGEKSMHGFKIKSFISLMLGFLLVLWSVASFYFLFDNIDLLLSPFVYLSQLSLVPPQYSAIEWGAIALLSLLTVAVTLLDIQVFKRERVIIQKTLSFIILIAAVSIILHFLYWQQTSFFILQIIIMLSFIVAHYFSHVDKKRDVYLFIFSFGSLILFYINYLMGNPLQFL